MYCSPFYGPMRHHMMGRMMNRDWREIGHFFPMDIVEEKDGYTLTAFLPGVSSDSVDIQIENDIVTIQANFSTEHDEKTQYLLDEIPEGKFHRSVRMPVALDAGKAEASLKDGVLKVHLMKAEEARPKTVKVNLK